MIRHRRFAVALGSRFGLFVRQQRWLCFTGQSRRRWAVGFWRQGFNPVRVAFFVALLGFWWHHSASVFRCGCGFVAKFGLLLSGGVAFNALFGLTRRSNGARRPLAVLKFSFLSRFGGFVSLLLAARPLP